MPQAEKIKRQMSQILKRVTFPLLLLLILLVAGDQAPRPFRIVSPVYAAGGTCPSGANYLNASNPTGALVTLASLGVTNCYYVSAAGADTNNGTSESTPWLHAPFMPNCTGNCATVTTQSASLWPGTGIIFRGGDTWHFGNSGAAPYVGGTWEWNTGTIPNGTTSNPIYLGVDPTWYSGASWVRPVLTADNPLCNASTVGTLSDGATCTGTTDTFGQPSYYVSSCAYQISSSNNLIDQCWVYGFIWDNFEMTGLCQSHTGQPAGEDTYLRYGTMQGPTTFQNNYIHGATHLRYAATNGSNCTGIVCININAFNGGASPIGETIVFNVVDFSDSDPVGENLTQGGFYNVAYNVFRYTTQALVSLHLFHDNLYEYFFENGHSNMIESSDPAGTNAIYNNVFRHVEANITSNGGAGIWLGPASGATDYFFNNVMYDVGAIEYFNIGGVALTTVYGNYVIFNNTFQKNIAGGMLDCENYTNGTVADTNNHAIDDSNYNGCSNMTRTTYLWQSNTSSGPAPTYSDANKSPQFDQYTSSETYAYSPVASTNSTVGAGTNEVSNYCGALSTAGLTAAATACKSDTTYSCTYNSTNHTVTCPARTVVARPISAAWDVGAYQFSSAPPSAPSNLQATPH